MYPNIPTQLKGGSHNIVSMQCANSIGIAETYFEQLQYRLKSVNEWDSFSEKVKAKFFLIDSLRPCPAPNSDAETVAHFYNKDSTNTFIVRRIGTCIYAEVHGRNQIENTSEGPILDIVRNKAIAIGSKFGFGSLNWIGFANALLEPFKE